MHESFSLYNLTEMVGRFISMFLKDQDFGHVDRVFIIRCWKDLATKWIVVDYQSNVHHVTYNMDIHTPMITQGWNQLRSFYGDHQLSAEDHPELFFEIESERTSRDIKVLYPFFWY
ncbi:uncharacterized protein LOC114166527 isoform X2 [Vigna unguiculata]|uniref:uncharacterized protein LOC114166527 isoform X2 n=1 Tax=Vigna unguiculata TaxID=3917 RepID=UPI0010164E09|nr:uncharacterized protein LOC114166527 isoform X2 [Vigna unguiculata]